MDEQALRRLKAEILMAHMLLAVTPELCQRIADEPVPRRVKQLLLGIVRRPLELLDNWSGRWDREGT